ncbi:hypothetical protein B7Z28_01735 [Candidatus Saccharibacteria bacterium 32-45-3]|nr:MAG: hypothetical protein B7Z28_01735 [Candidatus Saccharibacteria bacterium 32-45-3]
MKQKIKMIVVAALAVVGLGFASIGSVAPAYAASADEVCKGVNAINPNGNTCKAAGEPQKSDLVTKVKEIINLLLFIVAALAVVMIIVGGIRYVLSAGNQAAVTAAKSTIVYSVIGLIIAILAFAIVNFIVTVAN